MNLAETINQTRQMTDNIIWEFPLRFRAQILWQKALILFYFDNTEKQEKAMQRLQQLVEWATLPKENTVG